MKECYYLYSGSKLTSYDSLSELCLANFKINLTRNGVISVHIKPWYDVFVSTISYNMNEYSREEAIADFCTNTFYKHLPSYGYTIIKGIKL